MERNKKEVPGKTELLTGELERAFEFFIIRAHHLVEDVEITLSRRTRYHAALLEQVGPVQRTHHLWDVAIVKLQLRHHSIPTAVVIPHLIKRQSRQPGGRNNKKERVNTKSTVASAVSRAVAQVRASAFILV